MLESVVTSAIQDSTLVADGYSLVYSQYCCECISFTIVFVVVSVHPLLLYVYGHYCCECTAIAVVFTVVSVQP